MRATKNHFLPLAVLVLGVSVIAGTALWMRLGSHSRSAGWNSPVLEGLGQFGPVPEFSLIERSGKRTTLADLRGNIWIADFIYTSCQDTCPLQSAEMARLQDSFANEGLLLVSFSVDPERDTPQVLSGYAGRFNADPSSWLFLTGDKGEVARLAQEGFRLSAAPAGNGNDDGVFIHSARFVLVDRGAQIRGYYDSRDATALKRLREDFARLLQTK